MTARAIVLIGPMGVGKSSIGRKLAKALSRTFTDTDSVIARENGPIPTIFAEHGETYFRERERDVVARAVAEGGVVALGGGAPLNRQTQRLLREHSVILLDVSETVIAGRIGQGEGRPLLADSDPVEKWKRLRAERWPVYESLADVTFDTSRGHIAHIVSAIAEWVQEEER
ncbi:shikimate kinase [Microbacterium sp. NC79]|uniref:shikimate kinase n=1 Tax=Microbacterium sp. NC79 TaxID=2851009 RepID=UPI001C2C9D8E|nr:shikimate kinase [Microbacterium sp. NC79]MBV0894938.1 shikimate kinase [Microbacterium sp. NC79]